MKYKPNQQQFTMSKLNKTPPVLFIIFNRPDLTQRVFERIRQAQPAQLFIAADGPRPDVPTDEELCAQARQVVEQDDWKCEVHTLFRDTNLGCKQAVSSAIDWFFEHVEAGIILEDDCLPSISFFQFCSSLLDKYRDDERIMMISGNNYLHESCKSQYSYYFSRYTHIWGWATWKRAWRFFDAKMVLWPEIRDNGWLENIYDSLNEAAHRKKAFEGVFSGVIDSWGYAWSFACLIQNGLVIRPQKNLVSNIGFGPDSTHTKQHNFRANYPRHKMTFPLKHPPYTMRNHRLDQCEVQRIFGAFNTDAERKAGLQNVVLRIIKRIRMYLSFR